MVNLCWVHLSVSYGFTSSCSLFRAHLCWGGGNVAIEVYIHVLVFNPDGIVLVRRILYYLIGLVVLEPSRRGLYLEGKMLDLRIDIGLWSTLDQCDAPLWRAQR